MWYGGVDLGKRNSKIVVLSAGGKTILEAGVKTTAESFRRIFAQMEGPGEIACEPSIRAHWLAAEFEHLGIPVRIGDPSRIRRLSKTKLKKGRIDGRTLAELLRSGLFPDLRIPPSKTAWTFSYDPK
ncbi:MAG: transposase [Planctomycetes bacterium]|nr:transposase [Planctomycetota bacterium]